MDAPRLSITIANWFNRRPERLSVVIIRVIQHIVDDVVVDEVGCQVALRIRVYQQNTVICVSQCGSCAFRAW